MDIEFITIGDEPEGFQERMKHHFMEDGRLDTKKGFTLLARKGLNSVYGKAFLISGLVEMSKIKFFIETGTFLAETLMAVSPNFTYNWSVEAQEDCFKNCQVRTQNPIRKNIKLFLGESPETLPIILSELNERPEADKRCMFFLDAHFSGTVDASASDLKTHLSEQHGNCPLTQEIKEIGKHEEKNHLILIDDVRMMGTEGWPTIEETLESIKDINQDYSFKYCTDLDILIAGVFK